MGDLNVLKIVITFLATIFTVTYSLRLFMYIVTKRGNRGAVLNSIEMWIASGPMRVLFIFAVVRGAMMG
jgi:branched-subunit amino acid transport protein AzlD